VNDSFCPNGGYSETRKIGERKNVGTESERGPVVLTHEVGINERYLCGRLANGNVPPDWSSAAVLQAVSGDALAIVTATNQPTKSAATEGDFQTRSGAPLRIGGLPDMQTKNAACMATMFHVGLILWGWGLSQSPVLLQGDMTVSEVTAAPLALWALLGARAAGFLVLRPSSSYLMQISKATPEVSACMRRLSDSKRRSEIDFPKI
jgi:hypothetical protein